LLLVGWNFQLLILLSVVLVCENFFTPDFYSAFPAGDPLMWSLDKIQEGIAGLSPSTGVYENFNFGHGILVEGEASVNL
jgi:hypothetical protein